MNINIEEIIYYPLAEKKNFFDGTEVSRPPPLTSPRTIQA